MTINGLDFAIIFAFLAIIGIGFLSGIARVVAAIVAIYLGSAVAAAFYRDLADEAREHLGTLSLRTRQLAVFTVVFVLTSAVLMLLLVARGLKGFKLPRRVEIVDNLGGAGFGVIVSGLAVTLAAMLLSILLSALNQSVGQTSSETMSGAVNSQVGGSQLIPVFLDLAPVFTAVLEPLIPGGLPPILDSVPRA